MALRIGNIIIDCDNLETLADFWSEVTGFAKLGPFGNYMVLANPEKGAPGLILQKVPEKKVVKNRVHLDWFAGSPEGMEAEVARLEGLGATKVRQVAEMGIAWTIMHDPEGNEFCVANHD
jgi:predicted enzyme related to lactoylglutathione lyase